MRTGLMGNLQNLSVSCRMKLKGYHWTNESDTDGSILSTNDHKEEDEDEDVVNVLWR